MYLSGLVSIVPLGLGEGSDFSSKGSKSDIPWVVCWSKGKKTSSRRQSWKSIEFFNKAKEDSYHLVSEQAPYEVLNVLKCIEEEEIMGDLKDTIDYVYMEDKYEEGSFGRRYHEMLKREQIKKASSVEESSRDIELPQAKIEIEGSVEMHVEEEMSKEDSCDSMSDMSFEKEENIDIERKDRVEEKERLIENSMCEKVESLERKIESADLENTSEELKYKECEVPLVLEQSLNSLHSEDDFSSTHTNHFSNKDEGSFGYDISITIRVEVILKWLCFSRDLSWSPLVSNPFEERRIDHPNKVSKPELGIKIQGFFDHLIPIFKRGRVGVLFKRFKIRYTLGCLLEQRQKDLIKEAILGID
ncbi:hypothetical protein M9H77_17119 [Catharanthus roseus]|uniref:Uncharacterized protein n=1 Tax=Catharanthus roseus TaxID=4058 RepID=A0ACC0B3R1_CATRO|nr:hypothetical protein M9H77_17119 [Catharanthus roseus]